MVQITTDYSRKTLEESVRKIAEALGTGVAAESSIRSFLDYYAGLRGEIAARGGAGKDIICHAMQTPYLKDLGFTIKAVYGPAPLEPSQLKALSGLDPLFIIDNWHNPVAQPLNDLYPNTPVAVFINFPGQGGTVTLMDVLEYNRGELLKAF